MGDESLALIERVKELTALHGCARILVQTDQPLETLLAGIVGLLPPAFQWPARATAAVRVDDQQVATDGHRPSPWMLRAAFTTPLGGTGEVVVAYHEPGGPPPAPVFLVEEQALLDSIADMVLADARRRVERERLALALVVAEMGIWEWEIVSNRVRWSGEMARFVGHDSGDLVGVYREFIRFVHPDDQAPALAALADAARQDGPGSIDIDLRLERPGGGWRHVNAVCRVFRAADGNARKVLAAVADVTNRRALEARVRQSQKLEAMGLVCGSVAHDFNNVLTVVTSCTSVLCEHLPPGENRDIVGEIMSATTLGTALARQLLTFGLRTEVHMAKIELTELMRGMEPVLARLVKASCELTVSADPEVLHVYGDAGQLEQVLMNLVVNARDAMESASGGVIRIATRRSELAPTGAWPGAKVGPCAQIEVADSGHGIPPDIVARIFEPFFTTKEPGKGTGLGLAVVFGVVKKLGGQVLTDTKVGEGTTFRVLLPLCSADSRPP